MATQAPKRTGLLEFLRNSNGCQFIIPVYQRNYAWTAEKEVKLFFNDLGKVLNGTYHNHFLGIMIYLDKTLDYKSREFSVIDGQQRLTTTFLILYAIRQLFLKENQMNEVAIIDDQYLTNPHFEDKLKYKLKPLVSDDNVYQKIIEGQINSIENKNSNVYKNYIFIDKLIKEWRKNYTLDQILQAMDPLYIVCIPVGKEDNAQKIFESINATGKKLTASDLIRNYTLMNQKSDLQEQYYSKYWQNYETLISNDPRSLESFFRFFLSAKEKNLCNKNMVYDTFIQWFEQSNFTNTEECFQEILTYAKCYNDIYTKDLVKINSDIKFELGEFRKIDSYMPAPLLMELFKMYNTEPKLITGNQLSSILKILNTYLVRRSLCDLSTSDITRLFVPLLKNILEDCKSNYKNIVEIFIKYLITKNKGNSMYMPDDKQLYNNIYDSNMYTRSATRIFLEKLELYKNPAPIDLSALNIEHLMPQTASPAWITALKTTPEKYEQNLHRLGNLTLATKIDNSKMSNNIWDYKNTILSNTNHLNLNTPLLNIKKWTLEEIEKRTVNLIEKIKLLYPYITTEEDKIPIFLSSNNINATGYFYLLNGSVEISAGSELLMNPTAEYAHNGYNIEALRAQLLKDNILLKKNNQLLFIANYRIESKYTNYTALSSAAALILFGNRNGWEYWKDENGIPLNDRKEIRSKFF